MRVLMISSPVPTHFTPMIPLAWALRAAGHEVTVLSQPDVMGAAGTAGLVGVSYGGRFDHVESTLRSLAPGQRPLAAWGRVTPESLTSMSPTWVAQTEEVLPQYLTFTRAYAPHLIVADPMEAKGVIVGGLLDIPVVLHRWGVDPVSAAVRVAAWRSLEHLLRPMGLEDLPEPAVIVDPCPPSLQLPGAAPGLPIRAMPFNGSGAVPTEFVTGTAASAPGRRVAVCLGTSTLALHGVPLMRAILRSFAGLAGVEAVATVDSAFREAIGRVPANVRLVDPVPLQLLLATCSAIVHHGGAGTTMTAIAAGRPQLVLPQMADQFAHGDRVVDAGAGICLDDAAAQEDASEVRAALSRLSSEAAHRSAAHRLRQEADGMPVPQRVVSTLEGVARQAVPARRA
ncbi:nucleotide disphospho-sugar-binding domain-containing protein [Streptomyces sp. ST2-7A]|uniref:nucleotide disphospho-sugar-binding domain-containing protein n=1 Tax=Streptomyces sp. ST2-7A TaxID=2907214 RepID=UPI001F2C1E17|nr:nucleotide disphospho-sugar-binding domain-containing protein [Streptomyces sp. ST2-7A]MCE7082454.1 DUF1205 domain-containing protein [Streptomyces sp. ST2-7A]